MQRALLCVAILSLLVLSVVADGGDSGGDDKFNKGNDGGGDGRGSRKITKVVAAHTVVIRADKKTEDQKNRLRLDFTTNGFPRLRLSRLAADETNDNKVGFTFRIGLRRVVEFVDQGSNCLDLNDTISSQFSLIGHSSDWSNIQETITNVPLPDNTTAVMAKYCTTLTRGGSPTAFELCLRLADRRITQGGRTFGPSRVKLDIRITGYQFSQPTGASKLALVALISSRTFATNSSAVPKTVFFNSDGAVDWQGTLDIPAGWPVVATGVRDLSSVDRESDHGQGDGNSGSDDDSFKTDEIVKAVGFCIDNTTHVNEYYWDPTAEINDQSSSASAVAAFFVPLLMAVLALLALN